MGLVENLGFWQLQSGAEGIWGPEVGDRCQDHSPDSVRQWPHQDQHPAYHRGNHHTPCHDYNHHFASTDVSILSG